MPAAQSGMAYDSPITAVATSVPTAKKASRPAALNIPTPIPARLPFSATSAWARRISERISSGICCDRSCTRPPNVGSTVLSLMVFTLPQHTPTGHHPSGYDLPP